MRKAILLFCAVSGCGALLGWEESGKSDIEQVREQLKSANDRIAQLDLQLKQQQGLAQFFQAGQALCELDKRQTGSKEAKDDHK